MKQPEIQFKFSKDRRVTAEIKQRIRTETQQRFDDSQAANTLKQRLELTADERKKALEIQTRLLQKLGIYDEVLELAKLNRQISARRSKLLHDDESEERP